MSETKEMYNGIRLCLWNPESITTSVLCASRPQTTGLNKNTDTNTKAIADTDT